VRIKSEHAVGHLKGRFQSLKGLRQQIKNETDHLRAVEWVRACIVLHTMIHVFELEEGSAGESDWEEEMIVAGLSTDESSSSSDDGFAAERRRESTGQRKRRKVKEALFTSGIVDSD
jgi:hypothetical protein